MNGHRRFLMTGIKRGFENKVTYYETKRNCSEIVNGKTHILFLHFGLPRTEFYAKDFLKKSAAIYYQIPKKIEKFLPSGLIVNEKVRTCIEKYGESCRIDELLNSFADRVRICLNTLVPEFKSITCSYAFLFDEPSIEQEILEVARSGCDHIVAAPLYAHFSCAYSGFLLNEIERVLNFYTVPAIVDGKEVHYKRILPNSSNSFHVSALHRWNSHPVVSERSYNSKEYRRSVWSACERVMNGLNDRLLWRLGFYNAWDQWDLPVRESIEVQTKRLAAELPVKSQIAIVPITSLFPDFNTLSVIPSITQLTGKSLVIQPERDNTVLLQGVVEVIKNHLLGRRNVQLRGRCHWCTNKHCKQMRIMFDDS
ncbi:ferrochelatase [Dictyocaulus viviparus]|uniref:Ferrochelatase n=1 Tax=Dictyocaulus viviparus TaxID=29172 RepID=A0A0D8XEI7_DICVI|nr:ferrochelatase [Dictyocaulus viviparus]